MRLYSWDIPRIDAQRREIKSVTIVVMADSVQQARERAKAEYEAVFGRSATFNLKVDMVEPDIGPIAMTFIHDEVGV